MINPKEKAIELLDKYIQVNMNSFFAKDCVLVAVEEILKLPLPFIDIEYGVESYEYWQQVKTELEKL